MENIPKVNRKGEKKQLREPCTTKGKRKNDDRSNWNMPPREKHLLEWEMD